MTANNSDTWGAAPGAFNSTYVMNLTLSTFKQVANGYTANGYRVEKTGNVTHNLTVDFDMTTKEL